MKKSLFCLATLIAVACCANVVRAGSTLAYSFEDPAFDGFFGLGATVTQDTIGATQGNHSIKYAVGGGGFVGARTETVIPAALGNPPGVDYVLFDLNLPEAYGGTFADLGVTIFGTNPSQGVFGAQAQFGQDGSPGSLMSIAALSPGQHNDLRINLTGSNDPTFAQPGFFSFNQIFGPGSGQLTSATAFQFFISKNAANPVTVYIDNVRLVGVPEPATCTLLCLGAIGLVAVARRRLR
jgi:PEP-CTERM motif